MRSNYDSQLGELHRLLLLMGAACSRAIATSVKALEENDTKAVERLSALDDEIDGLYRQIQSLCQRLILREQPVASDLRQISAALKMITDLERIGDQAEDISEIIPHLDGKTGSECGAIHDMAETAISMVTDSIEAYSAKNAALAAEVIERDDIVDAGFTQARDALISMISADNGSAEYALDLLMIAKYLERIGDHATNIAELVSSL